MALYLISVLGMFRVVVRTPDRWLRMCGLANLSFIVVVSQTTPSMYYSIPYGFGVGLLAWLEIHSEDAVLESEARSDPASSTVHSHPHKDHAPRSSQQRR